MDTRITKTFESISADLETVNRRLEQLVPRAIVKRTTSFGNSSHIVLPKDFLNKEVGVIILNEQTQGGNK